MFVFSLAERLGMTVAELLERIDSTELAEWLAYARLQADPKSFNTVEENLKEALRSSSGKR
jgi:hypothetical protein